MFSVEEASSGNVLEKIRNLSRKTCIVIAMCLSFKLYQKELLVVKVDVDPATACTSCQCLHTVKDCRIINQIWHFHKWVIIFFIHLSNGHCSTILPECFLYGVATIHFLIFPSAMCQHCIILQTSSFNILGSSQLYCA